MIIVMRKSSSEQVIADIIRYLEKQKLQPIPLFGTERTVIAVIGDERNLSMGHLESLEGVDKVMRVLKPYKLVSREAKEQNSVIEVNGVKIGDPATLAIIAGPCSVESEEQMEIVAGKLAALGVKLLRGGAFKPRTAPYAFQGLGRVGLEILSKVAKKYGMAVATEIMDVRDLDFILLHADIIQVGARNMQNFELLKELGRAGKPILLKRGMVATIEEFLLAAEYLISHGNHEVILCERGIRTYETDTRFTLPVATIPIVKELSHLPIIVDPSHAAGRRTLVEPLALASIAGGVDGLIIEVHPDPEQAKSDAQQQLTPEDFSFLLNNCKKVAQVFSKTVV